MLALLGGSSSKKLLGAAPAASPVAAAAEATNNIRASTESESLARTARRPALEPGAARPEGEYPRPLWLDCDPGHDDALALILAAHHPRIHLLGVSTVAGNQAVGLCTANALAVLHAAGAGAVPVYEGAAGPLLPRPAPSCPEIHGSTGLDAPGGGRVFADSPNKPGPGPAISRMYEAIRSAHEEINSLSGFGWAGGSGWKGAAPGPTRRRVALVCTGSLTNAALMLRVYPDVAGMAEVVIMGGAVGVGNTSPGAEFNIQNDPEAASIVFEGGWPVTIVPLEVTHTALATPAVLDRIRGDAAAADPFRERCGQLLEFFSATYRDVFFFEHPPVHDPCAVAYLIRPDAFTTRSIRCDVELSSGLSPGRTVFDIWNQTNKPHNVRLCLKMDVAVFWDLVVDAVAAAARRSPLNPSPSPSQDLPRSLSVKERAGQRGGGVGGASPMTSPVRGFGASPSFKGAPGAAAAAGPGSEAGGLGSALAAAAPAAAAASAPPTAAPGASAGPGLLSAAAAGTAGGSATSAATLGGSGSVSRGRTDGEAVTVAPDEAPAPAAAPSAAKRVDSSSSASSARRTGSATAAGGPGAVGVSGVSTVPPALASAGSVSSSGRALGVGGSGSQGHSSRRPGTASSAYAGSEPPGPKAPPVPDAPPVFATPPAPMEFGSTPRNSRGEQDPGGGNPEGSATRGSRGRAPGGAVPRPSGSGSNRTAASPPPLPAGPGGAGGGRAGGGGGAAGGGGGAGAAAEGEPQEKKGCCKK